MSDEKQVVSAAVGDRAAADALARKYQTVVLSLAYSWTRNLADAEDLAQEILMQAMARIGELKDPAAFAGWLRTIARNRCRAWYRNSSREELVTESGDGIGQMPDQEASVLRREGRQAVVDLLDLLSDGVALAARLHYVDGLTAPQIADVLDVPVTTVEGRLHRARTRFRAVLAQSAATDMKALLLRLITLNEGVVKMDTIRVEVGSEFVPLIQKDAPNLMTGISALRGRLEQEERFVLPAVRVRDSEALAPLAFRILVREAEVSVQEAERSDSAISHLVTALREAVLSHRGELVM